MSLSPEHTQSPVSGQADKGGWCPPKLSTLLQGTRIQTANLWKAGKGKRPSCGGGQEAAAAAAAGTQETNPTWLAPRPDQGVWGRD